MERIKFFSIILFFVSTIVFGQQYGTGALLDQSKFSKSPKAPALTRGDFFSIPKKFSLKKYAPKPGNQGASATCAGWAISYSARTILEGINNSWDANNAFSPSYVYNQIRQGDGCNMATSLIDGLNLIKKEGVLPYKDFGYSCTRKVEPKDKIKASKFRIKEYREILNNFSKNKVYRIKKSISQSKPVVIGIQCPKSLYSVKDVWQPKKEEYNQKHFGHAVTVIGYDDNKYGGAFEIMNSWGTYWADSGFAWIRYKDMQHFCVWAAELIGFEKEKKYLVNAEIYLKKINGNKIDITQNKNTFSTVDSLSPGDLFQLYIKNKAPTYLYIFSLDTAKGQELIFPNDSLTSEFLAYDENNIILPSEKYAFEMDKVLGVSSFIIVLSTKKIMKNIRARTKKFIKNKNINKLNILNSDSLGIPIYNNFALNTKGNILISKSSGSDFITFTQININNVSRQK